MGLVVEVSLQIDIAKSKEGGPVVRDKILSGVAFYEDRKNNLYRITCHGRRSIYQTVLDALINNNLNL